MIPIRSLSRLHMGLLVSFLAVFAWSLINPRDWSTYFFEVLPVVAGVGVLVATYNMFRLSNLVYVLLWIDAIIMLIGAHYSYAGVPLFDWIRDHYGLNRNYFDRVGHFAQGFAPAILIREILVRFTPVNRGKIMIILVLSVTLAISGFWELVEWGVTELTRSRPDAIIESQGDRWDTQWDMFMAVSGGVLALVTLSKAHDRSMEQMDY